MKKYMYLDLSKYMNHKMLFQEYEEVDPFSEDEGVMGLYVLSTRFNFEKKLMYLKEGGVCIQGAMKQEDNVRCKGQIIELPDGEYSKMLILGFHETGSYFDIIKLVDKDGTETEKKIMMYQMLENLEMLYECDMDESSNIAFNAETNAIIKMHYYVTSIEMDRHYRQLILQDNEEAHIAAISLVK